MKMKNDKDRVNIANPDCAKIVRDLFRIISCEIHDEENKKQAIKLIYELCTDKYDGDVEMKGV